MTVKLINPEHDPTIDVSSWKTIVLKNLHDIWKMSSPKVLAYLEIRSLLFLWLWWLFLNFRFAQNKNNQSWAPQPQASTPKHTLDRPATWRHQGESRVARKPCPGTRLPWSRHKFGNPLEIVEQLAPHLPPSRWRIRPSAARIDLQKHIELIYLWHPVTATFIDATLCEDLLHMVIKLNKAVSEIANHRIAAWNDL